MGGETQSAGCSSGDRPAYAHTAAQGFGYHVYVSTAWSNTAFPGKVSELYWDKQGGIQMVQQIGSTVQHCNTQ